MCLKELCDPSRPLVVPPKVLDSALDGRVGQVEHSLLFHALEVDHQHLSSRLLIGPVAESIWDGFVVLLDWDVAIIV